MHFVSLCHKTDKKLKVKAKVTLVQALRLCTGRTVHTGSISIALPFHDHGTSGKDRVPTVQEAGWAPGPVWTGAENLAPLGFFL